jgi:hypothetical protein
MEFPDLRTGTLERALRLGVEGGYQEHVGRCYDCLVAFTVASRQHDQAERWIRESLEYMEARDLDFSATYARAWRAQLRLNQGAWETAEGESVQLLGMAAISPISRLIALSVLGQLRARRGEPGAGALLDEARTIAEGTAELQRLGPVAVARAEAAWLAGDPSRAAADTRAAYELSLAKDAPWLRGALAVWLHRAGALAQPPERIPRVCELELRGDPAGAAAEWARLGCPYEQALALAQAGRPGATLEAIRMLERLGAGAAVEAVRRSSART